VVTSAHKGRPLFIDPRLNRNNPRERDGIEEGWEGGHVEEKGLWSSGRRESGFAVDEGLQEEGMLPNVDSECI